MTLTAAQLAARVDHTLLKPESSSRDFAAHIASARELGVLAICVSPSALPVADAGELIVATVCGFPSGAVKGEVKAAEAARAVGDGAREVDMVVNVGLVKDGDWAAVEADVRGVVDAVAAAAEDAGLPAAAGDPEAAARGAAVVKVIIESAALTDEEIVEACRRAEAAGAHYVKTSTGFHPSGGASVHAVRLMRETVGDRLGVKASGGIRTLAAAQEMLDAGASRLGLSGTAAILAEIAE